MFGGLSIGLNHGIMEYWNYGRVGFRKDIVDYKFYHQSEALIGNYHTKTIGFAASYHSN